MTDMTSPADAKVELAPRLELVERIKQLRAERKRYFDVEGDTVDLVLADCHAALEASADTPTEAITDEMIEAAAQAVEWDYKKGHIQDCDIIAIYTAMQAARPIAPVQDDDAERAREILAKIEARLVEGNDPTETFIYVAELRGLIECNRLTPTADHSLVEALLDIRSAYESEREDGVVVEEIGRILRREAVLLIGKQSADDRG